MHNTEEIKSPNAGGYPTKEWLQYMKNYKPNNMNNTEKFTDTYFEFAHLKQDIKFTTTAIIKAKTKQKAEHLLKTFVSELLLEENTKYANNIACEISNRRKDIIQYLTEHEKIAGGKFALIKK